MCEKCWAVYADLFAQPLVGSSHLPENVAFLGSEYLAYSESGRRDYRMPVLRVPDSNLDRLGLANELTKMFDHLENKLC